MRKELFKLIERNSVEIEESEKNGIVAHYVEVDDLIDDLEKLFTMDFDKLYDMFCEYYKDDGSNEEIMRGRIEKAFLKYAHEQKKLFSIPVIIKPVCSKCGKPKMHNSVMCTYCYLKYNF